MVKNSLKNRKIFSRFFEVKIPNMLRKSVRISVFLVEKKKIQAGLALFLIKMFLETVYNPN